MNPEERLSFLFEKYFNKTASEEDKSELATLVNDAANREQVLQLFMTCWEKYEGDGAVISAEKTNEIFQNITGNDKSGDAPVIPIYQQKKINWRIAAAAVLFFLGGIYWLFVKTRTFSEHSSSAKIPVIEVKPGTYKARLTLADGRTIDLDKTGIGILERQGNASVVNKDGQLVYKKDGADQEVVYNTLSTANGETYAMTLADGTAIWLNCGSSVRFPVSFPGKERRIEISGEVYIKVVKNPAQPFITSVNDMEVTALGTAFNINAYRDEDNVSTTLVEGSVKVNNKTAKTTLTPGQQAQLNSAGRLSIVHDVNMDEITSWKDGFFHFESADLKTILRQFARWYDVEVVYEGALKNRKFFAVIKRTGTLNSVLEMLKDNNIVYSIEGKKLIVKSG